MKELEFNKLTWQLFEKLIASLLESEGFVNVISAGGSGGDMGLDISADEIRRSLSGRVSTFRWMVQVKHYTGQPGIRKKKPSKNVGHKEIGDIITFLSEHKAQGFLLISDTSLTASAVKKITTFHEDQRNPYEAHFWDQRILSDRLQKHTGLLERYFQPARRQKGDVSQNQNPFKYLEPFRRIDRQLFFGRDTQIQELIGLVCNSPVIALFGESGTGKTSLLNAGLIPELSDQHFLVVYCRCLDKPADNVRGEVLRTLEKLAKPDELADLGSTTNTAEFFRRLKVLLGEFEARMVIIVDQFEEAFTRAGDDQRKSIAEAILVCSQPDVSRGSLTILFSIREDYIGSLWEWSHKNAIVDVWGNAYRISRLSIENARIAIKKPFALVNKKIQKVLENKLVMDLERIGDGKIYPPYVQIVCGSLFDEIGLSTEVTIDVYDSLGKAEGIIGEYLDSRLFTGLTPEYADIARSIIDSLTGGEGLRTLLSLEEIQVFTGVKNKEQIQEIIDFLLKRRVIVPQLEDEKLMGYELVHDFLSRRFFEKLNPEQKRERAIRDVFRRAFKDWKQHGILVSKSALDEFYDHRTSLNLNKERSCMIMESAFASGKYAGWKKHINDKGHLSSSVIYTLQQNRNVIAVKAALKQTRVLKKTISTSFIEKFLKDKKHEVRYEAVSTLGRRGDKHAVVPLLKSLKTEKVDYIRRTIAKVLGQLGDKRAVQPLLKSLNTDKDKYTRGSTAEALAQLGDKRAVQPLLKTLNTEKEKYTRSSIAKALGQLGDKRAVEPLLKTLKTEKGDYIRESIAKALGQLGDKRAVEPLSKSLQTDEDDDTRESIVEALGQLGDKRAVEPLLKSLQTEKDDYTRGSIVEALGQLGDKRAVEPLLKSLQTEKDDDIRESIVEALGQLGDKRAVEPLLKSLQIEKDDDIRESIVEALVQLGDKCAIKPIKRFLNSVEEGSLIHWIVDDALEKLES